MGHSFSPHVSVRRILDRYGLSGYGASVEEYCSVHLASLCETAYNLYNDHPNGLMVNYNTLPNSLIDNIFPDHFNIPLDSKAKQNVLDQSSQYSKQKDPEKPSMFVGDNEKKERMASQEILDVTKTL